MAAVISLSNSPVPTDTTQSTQIIRGSIALTGNYGIANGHGDILDFSKVYGLQSRSLPLDVIITEVPAAGTAPTGYNLGYAVGTNYTNGKLTIMSAVATEYTQGSAYSAALLGAKLYFVASFPML